MSDDGYAVGRIEEIAEGTGGTWAPLRRHFDVGAFGVNAWIAREAGEEVVGEHDEERTGHEELYVVVSGHATFTASGDDHDAPQGSVLFVRNPLVKRRIVAHDPGTTILSIGAKRGEAYEPRPWEDNYDAILRFNVGDYAGAKQVMLDAIERRPEEAGFLYNLACAEARLGERDAAIEHLAAAASKEERFADAAQTDEDLASIRDDPRFPASRPAA
jgi:hypothetical protein